MGREESPGHDLPSPALDAGGGSLIETRLRSTRQPLTSCDFQNFQIGLVHRFAAPATKESAQTLAISHFHNCRHLGVTPFASLVGREESHSPTSRCDKSCESYDGEGSYAPIPPCGPRIRGDANVMPCHSSSVLADNSRVLERQDFESCTIVQHPKFTNPHKH
jgi:hypothetical protein